MGSGLGGGWADQTCPREPQQPTVGKRWLPGRQRTRAAGCNGDPTGWGGEGPGEGRGPPRAVPKGRHAACLRALRRGLLGPRPLIISRGEPAAALPVGVLGAQDSSAVMGRGEAQAWLGAPRHAERRWWAATSWEGRVGLRAWQGHFTVRTGGGHGEANMATASRGAAEHLAGPVGGREGRPGRCRVCLGP